MNPQAIIERIWPRRPVVFEPLGGGITNHNFKVDIEGEGSFVLRIGGKDTELLGIDRHAEEAASRMAARIGVGPEVVSFLEPEGYLVTRFIEGSPIPVAGMRTQGMIERVAAALRSIHGATLIPGRFDAHRVVEVSRETAERYGVPLPHDYDRAKAVADRIEKASSHLTLVPCHYVLLHANFCVDGLTLIIIV